MNGRHRQHRGYSLMELLVILAIVILLAGIAIAAMPSIIKGVKRQETKTLVARIEKGLWAFYDERGYFPWSPDPPIPGSGIYQDDIARKGAFVLYRALAGDADMDGKVDPGAKPFVNGLTAVLVGDQFAVVDSFGAPIRYLAVPPGVTYDQRRTRNPDFDLWSLGGVENPNRVPSWITR